MKILLLITKNESSIYQQITFIENQLKDSIYRKNLTLKTRVTLDNQSIYKVILEEKPELIHFIGNIILQDNDLFRIFKDSLQCVIIQSENPQSIAEYIPYVIQLKETLNLDFISSFYNALAFNKDYFSAYAFAAKTLSNAPELWLKENINEQKIDRNLTVTPYVGLKPFSEAESAIFFARESHIQTIFNKLQEKHFIAIVGSSGVGKSSLIYAGLIPQIKKATAWKIISMRPENKPFSNLAQAFNNPELNLQQSSYSLYHYLQNHPYEKDFFILIDQFEELFRYPNKAEQQAFIKLILTSLSHKNIYIIITLRSDYLESCIPFQGLSEAIENGLYLIPQLTKEQLYQAITKPLHLFSATIEKTLVKQLLQDTEIEVLPILQHALLYMWRQEQTSILTLSLYQQIGGLSGALSQHFNKIYHSLSSTQQKIAEIIFKNLTEITDDYKMVRNIINIASLVQLIDMELNKIIHVIEIFQQENFLVRKKINKNTFIDITHETLIQKCEKIKQWAEEERLLKRKYYYLAEEALLWQQNNNKLLENNKLNNILTWYNEKYLIKFIKAIPMQKLIALYIQKSQQKSQDRKIIYYSTITMLFLTLIFIVFHFYQQYQQQLFQYHWQNAQQALNQNNSQQALEQWQKATKLSFLHKNQEKNTEIAIQFYTQPAIKLKHFSKIINIFPEKNILLTWNENIVYLWNLQGKKLQTFNHQQHINGAKYIKEKNLVIVWSDNTVLLWNGNSNSTITISDEKAIWGVEYFNEKLFIWNEDARLKIWDIKGQLITTLQHQAQAIGVIDLKDKILSWSLDHKLYLWSQKGQLLHTMEHNKIIGAIYLSDQQKIISWSRNNTIIIWSLQGQKLATMQHDNWVRKVFYLEQQALIVSYGLDNRINLWNLQGKLIASMQHQNTIWQVLYLQDKKQLLSISSDKNAIIWNLQGQKIHALTHRSSIYKAFYLENLNIIVTVTQDNQSHFWSYDLLFSIKGQVLDYRQEEAILIYQQENDLYLKNLK